MTKQELAKRILMLILPWPLSRLMPSGIRSTFTLSPGSGATPYIGSGTPPPTPGAGAIYKTIFMPTPLAPQGILSGVVAWPSNPTASILPFSSPAPSPDPPLPLSLLDASYWSDQADNNSYTVDEETGQITAASDFNLYPTDIISEGSEVEGFIIDFTESESIGTVDIYTQIDPDAIALQTITTNILGGYRNHGLTDDWKYASQAHYSMDQKFQIEQVDFYLKTSAGDLSGLSYQCQIWDLEGEGVLAALTNLRRSSNIVTGDNTWAGEYVPFTFPTPVIIEASTEIAIALTVDVAGATNYCQYSTTNNDVLTGGEVVFKIDGSFKLSDEPNELAIKIHYRLLDTEVLVHSFSDVQPLDMLAFGIVSLTNMFITFKDPSNPAAGIIITGFTADTYNFKTG